MQGKIHTVTSVSQSITELLLLADPDLHKINSYLPQSQIWVYELKSNSVGVCAIKTTQTTAEIMNLAVSPDYQGQGIGHQLIQHVIETLPDQGISQLIVKTGNSSLPAIRLYEKSGFTLVDTIQGYFVKHYPDPIYENGIQCVDQLVFEKAL